MSMLRAHSRAAVLVALLALVSACSSETPGDPLEEACRDVACGPGRCVLTTSGAACLCDVGHHADGLSCVADPPPPDPDVCEPNPCTEPHRTICTADGGSYQCACDAGYLWKDGQCVELVRPSCAAEPWPGGDAFEPDDCPERAILDFPMGSPQEGRTLAPAGDVDWYRIPVQAGFVYRVQAQGAPGVPLYLDVLTSEGLQPLAADHLRGAAVETYFKATGSSPVLVRLSTFDVGASSAYTLSVVEERADDSADTADGARVLPAGGVVVSGSIQFQGDVDMHVLPLEAGHSALLDAVGSPDPSAQLLLELLSPDGTTVLQEARGFELRMPLRVATSGAYLLRVRNVDPTARGRYRLSFQKLGPDDHGDDVPATTSLAAPSTVEGTFERELDVDAFTFTPVAGHQYRTRCFIRSGGVWCQQLLFRQDELPSGFWATEDRELKPLDATPLVLKVRSGSGSAGTYSVAIQDLGLDDHADTPTGATPVTVGGPPATGTLPLASDVDVFTFTAQARHIYRFQCGASAWLTVTAKDPAGQAVGQPSFVDSPLVFHAAVDGAHTLWVRAYSSSVAGAFSCQLTEGAADDHGNTSAEASPLPGGEGSGELQYDGDVDAFSAPTVAGSLYRVTLSPGTSRSLALDVISGSSGSLGYVWASSSPSVFAFKAATATTVFQVRGSGSSGLGTYGLRLEAAGTDDHGDTFATATPLTLPGSLVGALQFNQDVDVFSFAVTAGRIYRISCSGTGSEWLSVSAREGNDTVVASAYQTLLHRTAVSGTLAVGVASGSGAYTCTAQDVGTDDHPDTAEGALALSVPASGSGVLETYRDVDVFTFRPTAGRVYRASCTRVSCGVRLRAPDGKLLAEKTPDWNGAAVLGWEAGDQEQVSLEVFVSSSMGAYDYTLEEVGTDDHGDTSATATALGAGTVRVGAMLESLGDVDAFTFPATQGRIYRVRCVAASASSCTVRVKDPTAHGVPASHEAVVSGRYLVEVYSDVSGVTGTYALHVEDLGPDDHADSAAGATPLPAGATPLAGRLETFDDVDVFAISVTAPHAYRVACKSDMDLSGCKVRVVTPSGTHVASSGSFSDTASFETSVTGTLLVEISASSSQRMGTYTLTLTDLGLDDAGDTQATATALSLSVLVDGRFESTTDVDVYAVQLTGGLRYWVELSSDARFQLSVLDGNGNLLPLDFTRVVSPSTSGTYYLHFAASEAGVYQVRVQPTF
ncbi:pre-peptidase C-terminal domain-containing protein [Pyxidicoccus caerfyrddinensis]|uniref:pre-peptidase C-terminal domain-containing protein n=1 Tax=Pyxidicoccus caerfyrddinensis TaxID=2709663 RepID=UPI0013D93C09|nr:pre-peptidase C-terminal domain-containing protein [Pyxidicoccus caerfyrddinensis]